MIPFLTEKIQLLLLMMITTGNGNDIFKILVMIFTFFFKDFWLGIEFFSLG